LLQAVAVAMRQQVEVLLLVAVAVDTVPHLQLKVVEQVVPLSQQLQH
jgi:hypothetical protein